MKALFLRHQKLHLWLLGDLFLLVLFYLVRGNRALMNVLAERVTAPLRRAIATLTYRTEVSVMEVLCVLLVLGAAGYLLGSAWAVLRARGRRWDRFYSAVLGAGCFALSLWAAFCLLWGIHCWTDGFQTKSGIYAQPVGREDLAAVTLYFAHQLSEAADDVPREENGAFAVAREEILAQLEACRRGDISEAELQDAKQALCSTLYAIHDSPGSMENYYASAALSGLPLTAEEYREAALAATVSDLAAAAQTVQLHTVFFLKGVTA